MPKLRYFDEETEQWVWIEEGTVQTIEGSDGITVDSTVPEQPTITLTVPIVVVGESDPIPEGTKSGSLIVRTTDTGGPEITTTITFYTGTE